MSCRLMPFCLLFDDDDITDGVRYNGGHLLTYDHFIPFRGKGVKMALMPICQFANLPKTPLRRLSSLSLASWSERGNIGNKFFP